MAIDHTVPFVEGLNGVKLLVVLSKAATRYLSLKKVAWLPMYINAPWPIIVKTVVFENISQDKSCRPKAESTAAKCALFLLPRVPKLPPKNTLLPI